MECSYNVKAEQAWPGERAKVNPFMQWAAVASIHQTGLQAPLPPIALKSPAVPASPPPEENMQPVAAHYQHVLQGNMLQEQQTYGEALGAQAAGAVFPGVRVQQYMAPAAHTQQPAQAPGHQPVQAHKSHPTTKLTSKTKLYTEDANGEEVVYNGSAEHLEHHSRGEKVENVYECDGCDKAFTREEHLKRHAKIHTEEPVHRCEVQGCNKAFTRKERLTRHYKVTHLGQEPDRPFWCNLCGKDFQRKEHLQRHEKNIHGNGGSSDMDMDNDSELGESPGESRAAQQLLPSLHTATRSLPEPRAARHPRESLDDSTGSGGTGGTLHCTYEGCNKTYSRREHLTKHIKQHEGIEPERPYYCLDCGKTFTRKEHLLRHKRSHTGETPFTCPGLDCSKTFGRKEHLKRHMRVHTGEHPYPCSECGRSFGRRERLLKHLTTHGIHRLDPEPRPPKAAKEPAAAPTDANYSNLRKYPKNEPVQLKKEPDFAPDSPQNVFGTQTTDLLKLITQKGQLSPQAQQAYVQAQAAATTNDVRVALTNPELVRAFGNSEVVKAFTSPPKRSVPASSAEELAAATVLPGVTRGPDIANSPAMPAELSKLPPTFSIFPVVQGGTVVQANVVPAEQVQTTNGYYQTPSGYVTTTMTAPRAGELTTLPMSWPTGWHMSAMQPGMVMARSPAKVEPSDGFPAGTYFRAPFSS